MNEITYEEKIMNTKLDSYVSLMSAENEINNVFNNLVIDDVDFLDETLCQDLKIKIKELNILKSKLFSKEDFNHLYEIKEKLESLRLFNKSLDDYEDDYAKIFITPLIENKIDELSKELIGHE